MSKGFDVVLASCTTLPEPDPDEIPLTKALQSRGLSVATVPWDGAEFDWSGATLVLLRSTWNYYLKRGTFLDWARSVASQTTLHNPPSVVSWNTDKKYLADLRSAGVATVPTVHVDRGSQVSLAEICRERGWERIVVKPSVSAASYETHAMQREDLQQSLFDQLTSRRSMLVQPFVNSVDDYGERSIVVINGEVMHAVRKSPRLSGVAESIEGPMTIDEAERSLALAALGTAAKITGTESLLYARVDIARDASGTPMLMELELTEPSLFFEQGPDALESLADQAHDVVSRS